MDFAYTVSALGPRFAVTRGADVVGVFDDESVAAFLVLLLTAEDE